MTVRLNGEWKYIGFPQEFFTVQSSALRLVISYSDIQQCIKPTVMIALKIDVISYIQKNCLKMNQLLIIRKKKTKTDH